jgi:excisionase family DNA binding protein
MIVMEELMGTKEVAKILSVSVRSVTRLADSGELTGLKVGDLWRFSQEDITKYIANQRAKQQSKFKKQSRKASQSK